MSHVILAIDTSLHSCSVAIYKNKYVHSLFEISDKIHTVKILPMIKKILLQTKTTLSELKIIAFSKGPGNFTSMRIATSIVQSFSLSFNTPTISVSTLMILAEKAWRKYKQKKILVAIDAGLKKIYWAQYMRNKENVWIGEHTESLINLELFFKKWHSLKEKYTLVGNGWKKIFDEKSLKQQKINIYLPDAQDIIPLALFKIQKKQFLKPSEIKINYLNNLFFR